MKKSANCERKRAHGENKQRSRKKKSANCGRKRVKSYNKRAHCEKKQRSRKKKSANCGRKRVKSYNKRAHCEKKQRSRKKKSANCERKRVKSYNKQRNPCSVMSAMKGKSNEQAATVLLFLNLELFIVDLKNAFVAVLLFCRECVFIPCNHVCCCQECSKSVKESGQGCPVCRKPIEQYSKVYIA